ncbi:hypothetical protein BBR01nite_24960 [Brevibacillus brevis]|nr:hypothetical protein BBR01nite_24960 [Brevibacillus brevis]
MSDDLSGFQSIVSTGTFLLVLSLYKLVGLDVNQLAGDNGFTTVNNDSNADGLCIERETGRK